MTWHGIYPSGVHVLYVKYVKYIYTLVYVTFIHLVAVLNNHKYLVSTV